jgi:cell division protein FtsW
LKFAANTSKPAANSWPVEARWLRSLTFIWVTLGLVTLVSASVPLAERQYGDGLYFVKRQLVWVLLGLACFGGIVRVPLRRWLSMGSLLYLSTLGLVLATHIPGLGVTQFDATRWLNLGVATIQPSEFLKPALVLQAGTVFGRWFRLPSWYRGVWIALFGLGLMGILAQPNLSTTAICGMTLWIAACIGGLPFRALANTAAVGVLSAAISVGVHAYQFRRVASFWNPLSQQSGDGYQLVQSLIAIGSGGVWGTGYGLSQQKLFYLPIQHTDFIFAVFAEELGLVGSICFLLILLAFTLLGLRVAHLCKDLTLRLVACGSLCMLVGQAIVNLGVVSGILPTTGVPLPLFSYGGSSALASLAIAGFLVRAAREASGASVIGFPQPLRRSLHPPLQALPPPRSRRTRVRHLER